MAVKPLLLLALGLALLLTGCGRNMYNQARYETYERSLLFPDQASARPLIEGTVSRERGGTDLSFFTGQDENGLLTELPIPLSGTVIARGQERYNIFCAPCHDATGSGRGMVVQRGFRPPTSFHDERLRNAEPGHFFDVMTNGFGAMPDYRQQISARDRWTVVAYIRALQLSQHADRADVPGGDPAALAPAPPVAAPPDH